MKRKLIDTAIKCEADKAGASWFKLDDGTEVLTFTRKDAEWIAKNTPADAEAPALADDGTPSLL